MPELPEVETIRTQLQDNVVGKIIGSVHLSLTRILEKSDISAFQRALPGRKILSLIRRGKYLVFELDKGAIIFHLGMTGRLLYGAAAIQSRHTHLVILFKKAGCILFRDVRTFGRVIWLPDGRWRLHPRILRLGPEPLEIRSAVFLKSVIPVRSNRAVKVLLMEQSFLCGLGNIYCDESLFVAGIHPKRPASGLSHGEWKKLLTSVKGVLRKGIRNCGTTFSDYRQPNGAPGANQDRLLVYGRSGEDCLKCGTRLEKMVLGQRTTVFCPACQPYNRHGVGGKPCLC